MQKFIFNLLCCVLLAGCDAFPKDPEKTLSRIQESGRLTIGLVHNPPWVAIGAGKGVEEKLVSGFARSLAVKPHWQVVDARQGFAMLDRGELDILIGGFLQSTPYKKAGYTRPYLITKNDKPHRHVIAVRRGENRFLVTLEKFLEQNPVAVRSGGMDETSS